MVEGKDSIGRAEHSIADCFFVVSRNYCRLLAFVGVEIVLGINTTAFLKEH